MRFFKVVGQDTGIPTLHQKKQTNKQTKKTKLHDMFSISSFKKKGHFKQTYLNIFDINRHQLIKSTTSM